MATIASGDIWQLQRTEKDMKEASRVPIPGVSFERVAFDTHKANVELTALSGPMEGTVVKLALELPRDYPQSPPAVRVLSRFDHPNVYGSYLCLDMLRPRGHTPYAGWSPAYSLHALLFQLSTFLLYDTNIDQDYGGSVNREKFVKNRNDRLKRYGGDGDDCNTAPPPVLATAAKDKDEDEGEDDESVRLLLQRMEASLDLGAVETVLESMSPDALQKTLRLHPDGEVGHAALRRLNACNGKLCFCTKKSHEDPDTVICIGLCVVTYQDGNLKSISPYMSYLSIEAARGGVEYDVWNQSRLTHFLPIIINRRHAPRALTEIPSVVADIVGCAPRDTPLGLLKLVGLAMTTLAAEMMTKDGRDGVVYGNKSRYVSDAAMETFLHLHHLLVSYAVEHPEIAEHTQKVLLDFVKIPAARHKKRCPNLGILFVYMLLVPEDVVSWEELAPPLLRETLARNVLHASRGSDGDDFVMNLKDSSVERCEKHFRSVKVGLLIMALQVWFGNALMRPKTSAPADVAKAFERIRNEYDALSGQPSPDALEAFNRRFRDISEIRTWKGFMIATHLNIGVRAGESPIDRWAAVLRQAVRDSHDAGYHRQPMSTIPVFEKWRPDKMPVKVDTTVSW
jgi:ubiquitin-protein ligase